MRFMVPVLLFSVGCTPPVGGPDPGVTIQTATCGIQGQPCCTSDAGGLSCIGGLKCDGTTFVPTCGNSGLIDQPCGNGCAAPHQCMYDHAANQYLCVDVVGGGLTCGASGQSCCAEFPAWGVGGTPPPGQSDPPPIWCHIGAVCYSGQCV